jgi:hypothetical protein
VRLIVRYLAMQDVVDFALAALKERSPVGSGGDKHPGLYRDSHTVFLNGHVVTGRRCRRFKSGDQINISNPVPYSRKIEAGRGKMSVPGHVYEETAQLVAAATATAPQNSRSCRCGSATSRSFAAFSRRIRRAGACPTRRGRIGWFASRRSRSRRGRIPNG